MANNFNFTKISKTNRASVSNGRISKGSAALLYLENILFLRQVLMDATEEAVENKRKRLKKEDVQAAIKTNLQKLKK